MAYGLFEARLTAADGKVREERFHNLVTTLGRNFALDTFLSGANYTVTGPFVGLISSVGYSGIVLTDTMASHPGWTEAGNANAPPYGPAIRPTCPWLPAVGATKSFSAPVTFNMTNTGTIKGLFIVFGPGASNLVDSTGGVLYAAGLFTQGDFTASNGSQVTATYTAGL